MYEAQVPCLVREPRSRMLRAVQTEKKKKIREEIKVEDLCTQSMTPLLPWILPPPLLFCSFSSDSNRRPANWSRASRELGKAGKRLSKVFERPRGFPATRITVDFRMFSNWFIFRWKIISFTILCWFLHTSTWISHRHIYVPSLLNQRPPTRHLFFHPTPLGCHRKPVWVRCLTQQIPTGCLFYMVV